MGRRVWDMSHFELLTTTSLGKNSEQHTLDVEFGGTVFMLYLLNSVCQFLEEGNYKAISHRQRLLTEHFHLSCPRIEQRHYRTN